MKIHKNIDLNQFIGIILFLLSVIFIFNFRQFPYADDWIYTIPLNFVSTKEFIEWLFSQHVDHRIPIQKFIQFTIAYLFGYDFRVLILINLVIAYLTSIILVKVAISYRGKREWGDLLIPLILMNPASTYAIWAFQLQFLLSIFFISVHLYFIANYIKYKNINYLNISLIMLIICSFTGVNGVILCSIFVILQICYLFYSNNYKNIITSTLIFLLILVNIVLFLIWQPSNAVIKNIDFQKIFSIFLSLLISNMSVFSFDMAIWKEIIIVTLIFGTIIYCYKNVKRDILFYSLITALTSTLVVILSISLGRGRDDWGGGLMMHYSLLTLFIPISCWVLISKDRILKYFCIPLIVIYGTSFLQGYVWRLNYEDKNYDVLAIAMNDLRTNENIKLIVNKNPLLFTWNSSDEAKALVIDGILTLRISGFKIYNINGK